MVCSQGNNLSTNCGGNSAMVSILKVYSANDCTTWGRDKRSTPEAERAEIYNSTSSTSPSTLQLGSPFIRASLLSFSDWKSFCERSVILKSK